MQQKRTPTISIDLTGGVMLDIGCGEHKQEGFIGMDIQPLKGVDIVHDIEEYPWPIADEHCHVILASHIIEHINPAKNGFIRFMDECWRVSKPGGMLVIATPYANSPGFWQDPTHTKGYNEASFAYFDPVTTLYEFYKPKPWKVEDISWSILGNLEVVLRKRRENESVSQMSVAERRTGGVHRFLRKLRSYTSGRAPQGPA